MDGTILPTVFLILIAATSDDLPFVDVGRLDRGPVISPAE